MWKAFAAEGKGARHASEPILSISVSILINNFRLINEGCFVAKRYMLGDGLLDPMNSRPPRPMLPTRFEKDCILMKYIKLTNSHLCAMCDDVMPLIC
jgi:hypothetical protein